MQAYAQETIDSFDAHNAPELIRCKDCKECYFASNRIQSEQTFACGKHGIDVTQDWYCADGERSVK